MYRELSGRGGKLNKVKQEFGWDWWIPSCSDRGGKKEMAGKGFEWLEKERKKRKREEASSMFV